MTFKHKISGSLLKSDNQFVIDLYKSNPDYEVLEEKKKETKATTRKK